MFYSIYDIKVTPNDFFLKSQYKQEAFREHKPPPRLVVIRNIPNILPIDTSYHIRPFLIFVDAFSC